PLIAAHGATMQGRKRRRKSAEGAAIASIGDGQADPLVCPRKRGQGEAPRRPVRAKTIERLRERRDRFLKPLRTRPGVACFRGSGSRSSPPWGDRTEQSESRRERRERCAGCLWNSRAGGGPWAGPRCST